MNSKFSKNIVAELLYQEVKRKKMPQLDGSNMKKFKSFLEENGVLFTAEEIEAKDLKPVQEDYDSNKVKKMRERFKNKENKIKPLIVSEDYFILDGHHRWKAGKEEDESYKLPIVRMHLPRNQALVMLDDAVKRLNEDTEDYKIVAVYPGRFQPFHKGHFKTYNLLRDRFGRNHTFIATSNKTEGKRSPFNFKQKKNIITTMFDIPNRFVTEVKSPYAPKEILEDYDENNTVFVTALGKKDASRLSGSKYFEEYDSENLEPYSEKGYYYIVEKEQDFKLNGKDISGTQIREMFGTDSLSDDAKKNLFKFIYDSFNKEIYRLIVAQIKDSLNENVLNEKQILNFVAEADFKSIINEASRTAAAVIADDGPASWYLDSTGFRETEENLATKMGYEVINYLFDEEQFRGVDDLKKDSLKFVSFFPSGVFNDHVDNPLKSYITFADAVATTAGYEILKHIGVDDSKENKNFTQSDSSSETIITRDVGGISGLYERKKQFDSDLINEGGAFGHLAHPFEDMNLTFADLEKMIRLAMSGQLNVEGGVKEKTDGQNLMISWIDGEIRAARNKGNLKNFGENSLSVQDVIEKFEGRGQLKEAFEYAMKDLAHALSKLSSDKLNEIFKNGKAFMSLEVIYPPTQNVIPYNRSLLIFHGLTEYDEDGNPVSYSAEYADELTRIIKDVNADIQSEFKIKPQPELQLKDITTDSDLRDKLLNRLNKLRKRFDLSNDDEIQLYHQKWWEQFIEKKADMLDYDIPVHVHNGLVRRWAYGNKSGPEGYSIRDLRSDVDHEEFLEFAYDYDKNDHKQQMKKNIRPFEIIFLQLGAEVMKQASLALAADEDQARQSIITQLEKAREQIMKKGDEAAIKKMKKEFERLNKVGGFESIVPSEGLIFKYKGDLYKLTGSFAPINQILGIFKYRT